MRMMELKQSVLQDVVSLLDDNESMKKLHEFLESLKSRKTEAAKEKAAKRKEEILDDIREGLREVKAAREGKIKLQSAEEFLNELRG